MHENIYLKHFSEDSKMEFFPVVLRCGDVSVAVPIKILMQESSVFSAMFSSDGNRYVLATINSQLHINKNLWFKSMLI